MQELVGGHIVCARLDKWGAVLISVPTTWSLLHAGGFPIATSSNPHNSMKDMFTTSPSKDEEMTKWESQDSNQGLTNSKIRILATK